MLFRRIVSCLVAPSVFFGSTACTPTFDWREIEPEGSGIEATFPCRPDRHQRTVALAGEATPMAMAVCSVAETTFALAFVDVSEPARVGATIAELRAVAVANVGGEPPMVSLRQVRGMTPNPQSAHLKLRGLRPDGTQVRAEAVFFAKGLRVYQATVIGGVLDSEAVDTFLSSLKLPS